MGKVSKISISKGDIKLKIAIPDSFARSIIVIGLR